MDTLRPTIRIRGQFRVTLALVLGLSTLSLGCATSGPGAVRHEPQVTKIETEPAGASVFMEGGFVGTTPCAFLMPAQPEVTIRIERPGYQFVEELLRRHSQTPNDAAEGVGWDEVYFWPLTAKR
jgi:hypothetical protein